METLPVDEVDTIDGGVAFTPEDHVFGTLKSRFTENADGSARDIASIRLHRNDELGDRATGRGDRLEQDDDGATVTMRPGRRRDRGCRSVVADGTAARARA